MIVPGDANPLLMGGADGYQISRSVRLRQSASAYFNRTPASTTNRRTMTFSFWMKRGLLTYSANYLDLFTAYPATSSIDRITFTPSSDSLRVWFNGTSSADLITTQVFRDPSAWYHVVVAIDTTQATASNRIKVYVNGSQITSFSTATYPSQNYDTFWNSSSYASAIGANLNGPQSYFDGYLTEINFIDGQQLTPSSFGATNTTTGVWGPTKYTGTYGTNGFYLNFSDNSAATAAAIGKDSSGNGNNWTPNNISVTAGTTYDSMVDTPTPYGSDTGAGGEVRGNYAVLNPIWKGSTVTISNGNLAATNSANAAAAALSTIGAPAGNKIYWEMTLTSLSDPYRIELGMVAASYNQTSTLTSTTPAGVWQQNVGNTQGQFYVNTAVTFGPVSNVSAVNDVFMFAYDDATNRIWIGKNGAWFNSGAPASGTGYVGTLTSGNIYFPAAQLNTSTGSNAVAANFGQRAFAYTAPSGFKALNTQNLSTPTIANGAGYMAATTYDGNGSSQSLTNTVNSVSFQPDLVWVKKRSAATNHYLWDSVRGALKEIYSNLTNAESTNTIGLSAFNSNGFTLNNGDSAWNASGSTYVGWNWKKGATQGCDIVTFSQAAGAQNVAHSLGVTPSLKIVKGRQASDWWVYHKSLSSASNSYLLLNGTGAVSTSANFWNSGDNSSTFGIGSGINGSCTTFVAYLFAEISGYSAFGSYTGNGSADGPFIYTGFRPRWVLIKRTDAIANWNLYDTSRSTYNVDTIWLNPNLSDAELTTAAAIDILSNGFKCREPASGAINTSGSTYIYAAFAENPFKYSLAR